MSKSKVKKSTVSNYRATVLNTNQELKAEAKLSNRLNTLERRFPKIYGKLQEAWAKDNIDTSDTQNNRVLIVIFTVLCRYLFSFTKINLWNPEDRNTPSLLNRLIPEKTAEMYLNSEDDTTYYDIDDITYLEVGKKTNHNKGGISFYRMLSVIWNIAKRFQKKADLVGLGYDFKRDMDSSDNRERFPVGTEAEKLFNGEYDELLLECAEAYHKERIAKRAKKQAKQDKEETSVSEDASVSVEDYINGNIELSEINDETILSQFHASEDVTAAQKGAITRRINELAEETA